jgi:hypothetical protein
VSGKITRLELDGFGCPMAHCNRNDDSLHDLQPLRSVQTSQKIVDPVVSPRAFVHLGAFTGEHAAVCTYDSPLHPALVAYDYRTGSVVWTSPPEDLPGLFQRWPSGILLAKLIVDDRPPQHCVFAANPVEFVSYAGDGRRLWKRATTEVNGDAPTGVGMPTSLSFTDRGELVCVTTNAWVVKLDPLDGSVISSYRMDTSVFVDGREHRGVFVTTKSPVVVGDSLYLLADFKANVSYQPLHPLFCPVHLVRIELSQPGVRGSERQIKPLLRPRGPSDAMPDRVRLGVYKGTGSPPALVKPGAAPLFFAHAHTLTRVGLEPIISAVEDREGVLSVRWQTVLHVRHGDDLYAAPALHADTGTLLLTTLHNIYLFRNVASLSGQVPVPARVDLCELVTSASDPRTTSVKVGSPFGLAFDGDQNEVVAYTNFRITVAPSLFSYGFLGAFSVPVDPRKKMRPLWERPLGVTRDGALIPGFGTFGQPALFRHEGADDQATGIIVNTVATGTYIFR